MKRWLLVIVPLAILAVILFMKPPTLTHKTPNSPTGITNTTGSSGVKPGVVGGGEDEEGGLVNGEKPAYGGHEADNYDPE